MKKNYLNTILLLFIVVWLFLNLGLANNFESTVFPRLSENNLTKYKSTSEYRQFDNITRWELAKFVVQYATLLQIPTGDYNCEFNDINWYDSSLQPYIIKSCNHWLMKWSNWNFFPDQPVTKAQVATIIGRTLFWFQDESMDPRYNNYFNIWFDHNIFTSIENKKTFGIENIQRWTAWEWFYNWFIQKHKITWQDTEISIETNSTLEQKNNTSINNSNWTDFSLDGIAIHEDWLIIQQEISVWEFQYVIKNNWWNRNISDMNTDWININCFIDNILVSNDTIPIMELSQWAMYTWTIKIHAWFATQQKYIDLFTILWKKDVMCSLWHNQWKTLDINESNNSYNTPLFLESRESISSKYEPMPIVFEKITQFYIRKSNVEIENPYYEIIVKNNWNNELLFNKENTLRLICSVWGWYSKHPADYLFDNLSIKSKETKTVRIDWQIDWIEGCVLRHQWYYSYSLFGPTQYLNDPNNNLQRRIEK